MAMSNAFSRLLVSCDISHKVFLEQYRVLSRLGFEPRAVVSPARPVLEWCHCSAGPLPDPVTFPVRLRLRLCLRLLAAANQAISCRSREPDPGQGPVTSNSPPPGLFPLLPSPFSLLPSPPCSHPLHPTIFSHFSSLCCPSHFVPSPSQLLSIVLGSLLLYCSPQRPSITSLDRHPKATRHALCRAWRQQYQPIANC